MPKILITGSNGLLGQKLIEALRGLPGIELIATSKNQNRYPDPAGYTYAPLDITDPQAVGNCLQQYKPDAVIHTAAMTLVDFCEQNQDACWKVNVEATRSLVSACEKIKSHFIHLSSDFVFDGSRGPYREEDSPCPVNFYGKSKWESEKIVSAGRIPWTLLRTILVYGVTPSLSRSNIVLMVKNNLEQGKKIRIVNDQFRAPTLAEDLAFACKAAALQRKTGLYHISGPDLVSVYDATCTIAEVFGWNTALIEPIASAELKEPAKRPPKTGFILDKAKKDLGYHPHSLRQGLERVQKQITSFCGNKK